MSELPAYVIEYLAKAIAFLKEAPEEPEEMKGMHFYLTNVEVICEGEKIGTLVNEDPDWVYRPVESA